MGTKSINLPIKTMEVLEREAERIAKEKGKEPSFSGTTWSILNDAIERGITPALRPPEKGCVAIFRIPRKDEQLVSNAAEARGMKESDFIAGVLIRCAKEIDSGVNHEKKTAKSNSTVSHSLLNRVTLPNYVESDDQRTILENALQTEDRGKVGLIEASTGSGKGLVIALAAVRASENGKRVVIAAPTLKILYQLVGNYLTVADAPEYAVMIGRQEFVSRARIDKALKDDTDIPNAKEVEAWLENGAPSHPSLKSNQSYLADSLALIAPGFPLESIRLQPSDSDDEGMATYTHQFVHAEQCDVIFVSHSMLAIDAMRRIDAARHIAPDLLEDSRVIARKLKEKENKKADLIAIQNELRLAYRDEIQGVIPGNYDVLLVDEAHTLESLVSNALGDNVSIFSMRTHAKTIGKAIGQSSSTIEAICGRLIDKGRQRDNARIRANEDIFNDVMALIKAADALSKKASTKGNTPKVDAAILRDFKSQASTLKMAVRHISSHQQSRKFASISWTPVRSYPLITVGAQNVRKELDFIWRNCQSAALFSATLYLPPPQGASYMQRVLSVPNDKAMLFEPVISGWLKKPVTAFLPSNISRKEDKNTSWLQPPSRVRKNIADKDSLKEEEARFELLESIWHDELAGAIHGISTTSKGGSLVLCTSYRMIEEISDRLASLLGDRLIAQSNAVAFNLIEEQYRDLYSSGMRPVWLAVGRAWTGLDLTMKSVPAKDDQLLSDLAITKIPFSTNQSPSHRFRADKYFFNEANDAAITMRQGVGRLVRHPEAPAKRLWLLDSRLVLPSPKMKSLTKMHREIVKPYNPGKIKKVDFPLITR